MTNDTILKATEISQALKELVTDSMHENIDIHRRFRTISRQIAAAQTIEGNRNELIEVQKLLVEDAKGLRVKWTPLVQKTVWKLDELINALPESPVVKTIFPAIVRIP